MATYTYLQKLSVKYQNLKKNPINLPVMVYVELSGAVLIMLIPKSNI